MGAKFPAIASRGGRWLVVLPVFFLALTSMLKAIPTRNAAGYLESKPSARTQVITPTVKGVWH